MRNAAEGGWMFWIRQEPKNDRDSVVGRVGAKRVGLSSLRYSSNRGGAKAECSPHGCVDDAAQLPKLLAINRAFNLRRKLPLFGLSDETSSV